MSSSADVFLISENLVDGACVPLRLACPGENAISFKPSGDLVHAFTFEVFPVNAPNDFCLFRINDQVAISILSVTEKTVVVDLHMSLLVTVLQAEFHVLREALAFLLGKGGHDRQQYLPLGIHRVDRLFLEVDGDIYVLQLSDEFLAVQRVSSKPADRLSNDSWELSASPPPFYVNTKNEYLTTGIGFSHHRLRLSKVKETDARIF